MRASSASWTWRRSSSKDSSSSSSSSSSMMLLLLLPALRTAVEMRQVPRLESSNTFSDIKPRAPMPVASNSRRIHHMSIGCVNRRQKLSAAVGGAGFQRIISALLCSSISSVYLVLSSHGHRQHHHFEQQQNQQQHPHHHHQHLLHLQHHDVTTRTSFSAPSILPPADSSPCSTARRQPNSKNINMQKSI
jgi:hypothetical protein